MLMRWWCLPISYIGRAKILHWWRQRFPGKNHFREMCGGGRVADGGISKKFEEGWVHIFNWKHPKIFNEKSWKLRILLKIYRFFILTLIIDSFILQAYLPNSKLNDYYYEQGVDEQLVVNSEIADCFSCPRTQVIIKLCSHLLCDCCIEKHYEAAKLEADYVYYVIQCAVCKG